MREELKQRKEESDQALHLRRDWETYGQNDLVLLVANRIHNLLRNVLRGVLREEEVLQTMPQVPTVKTATHSHSFE